MRWAHDGGGTLAQSVAHLAAQRARSWASGDIVLSDKPRALAARWSFFFPHTPSSELGGSGKEKSPALSCEAFSELSD